MFISSGLFADINCPFAQRGHCERPHCLYKHDSEVGDTFSVSYKPSQVEFSGVQNGRVYASCGSLVNTETKANCHHELEQINKKIETLRHEVEQEQQRLSQYQAAQGERFATTGKTLDGGSTGLRTDFTGTHTQSRKYVVDRSKPKTDLQYDPLSNFSADLQKFNSSSKEQKVKNRLGLNKERSSRHCDQKEPASNYAVLSTSPSVDQRDDSNDDCILIIDVPPSPDKTKSPAKATFDPVDCKDTVGEEKVKLEPIPLNCPSLCLKNHEALKVTPVHTNKLHNCSYKTNKEQESENKTHNVGVIDLTGCLEDFDESQSTVQSGETVEKAGEAVSASATSDIQSGNTSLCELSSNIEKMNPLQPAKNSIFYKAPATNSPHRQHNKQDQPLQQLSYSQCPPDQNVPSTQKMPTQMQGNSNPTASVTHQAHAQPASVDRAKSSLEPSEQIVENSAKVIIGSSDEEEDEDFNYSDMELSDSDPMEECYRIFMEANNEDKGNEKQPDASIGDTHAKKLEVNVMPQTLLGKKRVSHESSHIEQPAAKSRPQPQVLVPLCEPASSGFGSRPTIPLNIQQVHQRASMLTASVKGGQDFLSSTCQKQTQSTPTLTPENLQPMQNTYLSFIPLGTTVDVGNNLHLILPEGTFPLTVASSSSPVTSVLTPISQVHMSSLLAKQTYQAPAVFPVQRCRPAVPVLIPAPARKPTLPSLPSLHSGPAASATPQPSVQASAKPLPTKRKLKQQGEAAKDKVPHNVRQHYVNMFTEEFLKTTANVNDAFERALAEERTVYNRSVNKLKYQSAAVNALKRLKSQTVVPFKNENAFKGQGLKGNVQLNPKHCKGNADDVALYESLKGYILSEEILIESNYPVQHPEKCGCAVLFADSKKVNTDPLKRICCRCGATYSVSQTGKHIRKEECNYHYGKGVEKKVPGGVETRYSCCEGVMGTPGCQVFKLHVHDSFDLEGFVSTVPRSPIDTHCPGVYSLDCEMCYTIHGLELSRVTVVNSSLEVVYDTFVKPDNEVIDYNTRFSGISEEDVKGNQTSLIKAQETLLSFISADTILIGHSLEKDLCLLKLLHGMVVDTSVVFPHRLGPPHKLTLNNLTAEYLRRIIQESVCGHDTAEDATACMELMLWKVKDDGKMKK
ncbi:RNA exonuclease 1 homolog [Parambassis ranga]|uniref:RNA exonuclease 1 homolog n=1 Tax=Parambassis ranga TaxID=210632 RepID=A0A6P7IZG3_9TELE|nr:RNA exonuclease 1 homolog [Parambassis ranga]